MVLRFDLLAWTAVSAAIVFASFWTSFPALLLPQSVVEVTMVCSCVGLVNLNSRRWRSGKLVSL